jgi:hypothetical protein
MSDLITARLRELLSYNPDSGEWIWLKPNSNRAKVGQSLEG